jgi:hypothetical protein
VTPVPFDLILRSAHALKIVISFKNSKMRSAPGTLGFVEFLYLALLNFNDNHIQLGVAAASLRIGGATDWCRA